MSKGKSFEATIRVPLETLRRTYREINMTGDELYAKTGVKRNEKLLSLDVKFENDYSVEINAYPGEDEHTGFVEMILTDAESDDRIWDTDGENILSRFEFLDGNMAFIVNVTPKEKYVVPFPVSWTVKMKKKQKETQDILSYHSQAAGCSDKARAKASGGRQPIEECGRTGL